MILKQNDMDIYTLRLNNKELLDLMYICDYFANDKNNRFREFSYNINETFNNYVKDKENA